MTREVRNNPNRRYSSERDIYIEGNTVRKTARRPQEYQYSSARRVVREVPGSIRKSSHRTTINATYVAFLTAAMVVVGYFCMSYLSLTSELSNSLTKIARLEGEYNALKAENDDFSNRINGGVDLEAIKKKAMNDLGMQYANDDQIVRYESDDTDYVRQYISLE